MSAAWESYREKRRRRRIGSKGNTGNKGPRRRHWLMIASGFLVAGLTLFALQQCLPQGELALHKAATLFGQRPASLDDPAADALVVYNENETPSRELADFYAQKRGIPAERVVGLNCSPDEEISREDYDQTIAGPLRELFDSRGWWTRSKVRPAMDPSSTVWANRIRYLVLMRGVPLKIRDTTGYPGDASLDPPPIGTRNAACVDSELAVLGLFTHHISGVIRNPYYRSYERFTESNHPGIMLATRLDGPSDATVRRMIEDSVAVEKTGLWGRCYVDGRGLAGGGPLSEGDNWLRKIATEITPYALPTIYDNQPALFAADYPMTGAALYFGWYSEQPAGALTNENFHFRPGAVACHIHSFSATSVRDPVHWWIGPLLDKGAAAVLGNVYEPYLELTTHLDIFADRLAGGMTFAESAYAATPALSWMNTFVGDPLYRPCAAWQNLQFDLNLDPPSADGLQSAGVTAGQAYYKGAAIWRAEGPGPGAKALEASAARLHEGCIYEGLGLLQAAAHNLPQARGAFEQAGRCYRDPADRVRVVLDEAHALEDAQQKPAAIEVLETGRRKYGTSGTAASLGELEAEIGPPANP